ncbi:MAG: hypothetical protein RIC85_00690 [Gammaproteobacteria bacterium]
MDTLKVLTGKSLDRILREGGTSSWKLDRKRAERATYAICFRNADRASELGDGPTPEAHGSAFVIGRIESVVPSPESSGRWLIKFTDYALLDGTRHWAGDRNPVIYDDLTNLGIDPAALSWEPMPPTDDVSSAASSIGETLGLSIAEAKAGLAVRFGVSADQVHIRIEA